MKWIFLVILLSGCAGSPAWHSLKMSSTKNEAEGNNNKIMHLLIGMNVKDALEIMGQLPKKREAYQVGTGKTIDFMFYRTSGWGSDEGHDTDTQFTPLAFENGVLVGWGRNYYDRVIRAAVEVTLK